MSTNTFHATAKKRQQTADEIIAAEAKKEAKRLEKQRSVDEKMADLHAEQAAAARCCTACQQTLPAHMFGKDKSRRSGFNPRCKPCNLLHVKGYVKGLKVERDPSLTPPRRINVMEGTYVPTHDTYYRNDGHKHIKSLGF